MPRFIPSLAKSLCLSIPLLLAACGGGGGDSSANASPSGSANPPTPTAPSTAASDPSATASAVVTASDYQSTLGTLPFTSTGTDTYAVTIGGATFSLDFSANQLAVSTPTGASAYEDGFVMLCSPGKADTVISHPQASAVTPATLAEIVGKRFAYVEHCAQDPGSDVLTINADGSASSQQEGLIPASEITAYLSTSGFQEGTENHIGHIYKVVQGGATRYVIVEGEIKNGTSRTSLLVEQATPPTSSTVTLVSATGYSATLGTLTATPTGASSYDIAVAGKTYALDFAAAQATVTAPAGATAYEDGFVMLCSAGKTDAVVSHPRATSVTPATLAEIAGRHFRFIENCALDASDTLTFNADGSATSQVDGLISASEVSAYLSPNGLHEGANTFIGHIYKVVLGGTTRYVVVEGTLEEGVSGVDLLVEQAP